MIPAAILLCIAGGTGGLSHGPYLGHIDHESAYVWVRAAEPGELLLEARCSEGELVRRVVGVAAPGADLTVAFRLSELPAQSDWSFRVLIDEEQVGKGEFRTADDPDSPSKVRVAFGSCASERRFPELATFAQILETGCDSMVFLGDTPYIDSTKLEVQRRRYREFLGHPSVSAVITRIPAWSTWDDHDFGRNDTDGRLKGKESSRKAHLEYHAGPDPGDGSGGIYRSFRRGPVEVFLIDARWYAGTEPSQSDPEKRTLLGAAQWRWLKQELAASVAPFKLLTTGMIWNGSVRPNKPDHWGNYPHEREALFRFLGKEKISGVVLIGGDIHRTRVVRHDVEEWVGYPLVELITSPMANSTIPAANQPHPGLLFDTGNTQNFMAFEADSTVDPPRWVARFIDHEGKELYRVSRTLLELTAGS